MVKKVYKIACGKGHKFDGVYETTHCAICGEKVSRNWKIETELESNLTEKQLLNRVCDWLKKKDPNFTCGELQEHDADFLGQQIILANWNELPNGIQSFIEKKCNVLTGFDDGYTLCSECEKIISTTPGYYGDQKNYIATEYDFLCRECALSDPESIIDDFKNNSRKALPAWFYPEIEKSGLVCYSPDEYCQKFETGFHPGQDDNPKKIAKDIEKELPGFDYLFKINNIGQFDIDWSVFIRKNEEE